MSLTPTTATEPTDMRAKGSLRQRLVAAVSRNVCGIFILLPLAVLVRIDAASATDCVVPSSDVTNSVTLRAAPNTTSAAVGSLGVGGSLPLVAAVPRWYEARRPDGSLAYVAKRWTVIAACPAGTPPPPSNAVTTGAGIATGTGFELHAIDVGTGLSVLVRGTDFDLLYDAGSNDDLARGDKNRTMAYLKTLQPQVQKIQNVILSHPHRDHVELLPDVVTHFQPPDVWNSGAYNDICGYRDFLLAVAAEASVQYHTQTHDAGDEAVELAAKTCYGDSQPQQTITLKHGARIDGQTVTLGQNASMTFLYMDGTQHSDFNQNSLVVRLDLGTHRILLMGDAEAGGRQAPSVAPANNSIEGKLLACCAADLQAEVLVVGHHGSKTSSRSAFLAKVGAKLFVISAGPTKYASVVLPDQEVVDEVEGLGQLFRTDLDDDACAESTEKVGPDNDGKPGGCDNVLIHIPLNGPVSAEYRRVAD
jgi:beta-lactamase superfamily II metal-dependent hydrolase